MNKLRAIRLAGVAAALTLLLALPAPAAALEQKLTATDGARGDHLGGSVAIDGDTAILGAPQANATRGAVYVFTRSGDRWTQTAKLTASDGAPLDALGKSVAIDGDTIVAGAAGDDVGANQGQGSVYIFERTGAAARSQTAKLTAADGAAFDALGEAVAIEGDTIVAGAPNDDVGDKLDQGSAYTFSRGAAARGVGAQIAKLTALNGAQFDGLGSSVALDGGTLVAGAPRGDVGARLHQGSVYVFDRAAGPSPSQTARLTAADGAPGDELGFSVALDGDTIAAGAPRHDVGTKANQGSAYTFSRVAAARGNSFQTAKLSASDGAADDELGFSVATDGETTVAGALHDDVGDKLNQGSAYTFAGAGPPLRSEAAKLIASDGAAGDELGISVALDGGTIIAGAYLDDVGANMDQGSASIFLPPAPVPPVTPPLIPGGATPAVLARASVSGFDFSPDVIAVARRATSVSALAKGGRFRYDLDTDARVSIVIERKLPGRRLGRRCVRPRRGLKRRCSRYRRRGELRRTGRAGHNTVPFSGRIGSRALAPGSYRARIRAANAAGASGPRTTSFRVVRETRRG